MRLELDSDDIVARIVAALDRPDRAGTIYKMYLEAVHLAPLLDKAERGTGHGLLLHRNTAGVSLDEKIKGLREFASVVSEHGGVLEVTGAFLRRKATLREDGTVVCPYCASVVVPQDGALWGKWCPSCEVPLLTGQIVRAP